MIFNSLIKIVAAIFFTCIFITGCAVSPELPKHELTVTPQQTLVTLAKSGPPIYLYLIALEDNGVSGQKLGCGDSLVKVETTAKNPKEALEILLSNKNQWHGQSGLYNALYQSNLKIIRFEQNEKEIEVDLAGNILLGGVCDNPRFAGQIQATINQSMETNPPVLVRINGTPLTEILSEK
jgi:hypothetical protein